MTPGKVQVCSNGVMVGTATERSAACWTIHLPAGRGGSIGFRVLVFRTCRDWTRTCSSGFRVRIEGWGEREAAAAVGSQGTISPCIDPLKFTHSIHTCALAAGLVHDLVHDVAAGLVVLLAQDDGGDLDQEALQLGPEEEGGFRRNGV